MLKGPLDRSCWLSLEGPGVRLAYLSRGVGEKRTAYVFCKNKESQRKEKQKSVREKRLILAASFFVRQERMRSSRLVKEFAFPGRSQEEREQKMMKKQGSIRIIKKEAEGARCQCPVPFVQWKVNHKAKVGWGLARVKK